MTPSPNILAGTANGSPFAAAPAQSGPQRNSLIPDVAVLAQPAPNSPAAHPNVPAAWLANAIDHAAVLSDTPDKWAQTVGLLKRIGIDPDGFEDFHKGRTAAMAATGMLSPPVDGQDEGQGEH